MTLPGRPWHHLRFWNLAKLIVHDGIGISVLLFFKTEVEFIYNVVVVSSLQQSNSVIHIYLHMHAKSCQSCLNLCNPMNYSPPGSSVHGILQARILERVSMPSSRGSSWPRDQTRVSCIAGEFFTAASPGKPKIYICRYIDMKVKVSHSVVSDSLWPHGL